MGEDEEAVRKEPNEALRHDSLETRSPGLLPARLSAAVADGVGTHVVESNAQE
ncbi:hypothetical protein [Streptomyces himalayensis]|uniref:Uncharacterized protein n=1 Tax=Streptomyces himalayensis subsp. himalayensis TaxID=2756131 RepID=A0A7W0IA24_9ACTN|nr:hypothetical protein [Streptomyces himalayensis]MBA2947942.1 hypothetical protein [Streptomyces himalayensis subsp. himalayensis]